MNPCLIVIPARLGSTRFPRKVLARLSGRSMVEWCWRAAVAADLGPVLIAADAREVADEVRRFGGQAVMTSPSCPSGSDRVWLAARGRREPIILNYQGDMPLLKAATLRAVVKSLSRGSDIATAVIPLVDERRARDPNVVKAVLAESGRCLYFSRSAVPFPRGGAPVRRWEHLGLYAYRREALRRFVALPPSELERTEKLEQLRALEAGMTMRAAVVCERPVSVDVPADLRRAQRLLLRGNQ
ncbi:MAG TPA: 3-deoxy-manno-octulosonate cytidylyltransferase [Elusimicrobia bacterium]|nr:MAG: 3-deoxy-D-manno-octulosonate cytidylyltransferase [Elusimicrobia bacterium GWA2_66_18]OGR74104.1 MAG: 3-deoxy-D-manno-octulosonate cytidylyltransferase [Elusimicrobia bacterium GWC2_65_9]HAZ08756.1 3-deoxy-manno-octulosonate cytidylyltransferase [Elusimicrobiota bacterium]